VFAVEPVNGTAGDQQQNGHHPLWENNNVEFAPEGQVHDEARQEISERSRWEFAAGDNGERDG
jgi:hypothetical protein